MCLKHDTLCFKMWGNQPFIMLCFTINNLSNITTVIKYLCSSQISEQLLVIIASGEDCFEQSHCKSDFRNVHSFGTHWRFSCSNTYSYSYWSQTLPVLQLTYKETSCSSRSLSGEDSESALYLKALNFFVVFYQLLIEICDFCEGSVFIQLNSANCFIRVCELETVIKNFSFYLLLMYWFPSSFLYVRIYWGDWQITEKIFFFLYNV